MVETDNWLVEYADGEKDVAKWLANNRFMSVEDEVEPNMLVVSGADGAIETLDWHDQILSVERRDG